MTCFSKFLFLYFFLIYTFILIFFRFLFKTFENHQGYQNILRDLDHGTYALTIIYEKSFNILCQDKSTNNKIEPIEMKPLIRNFLPLR